MPKRVKPKTIKIAICCFFAKHTALTSNCKDWLARIQDDVFEWVDMSIYLHVDCSMSQRYKNQAKRDGLVQSGHNYPFELSCPRDNKAENCSFGFEQTIICLLNKMFEHLSWCTD